MSKGLPVSGRADAAAPPDEPVPGDTVDPPLADTELDGAELDGAALDGAAPDDPVPDGAPTADDEDPAAGAELPAEDVGAAEEPPPQAARSSDPATVSPSSAFFFRTRIYLFAFGHRPASLRARWVWSGSGVDRLQTVPAAVRPETRHSGVRDRPARLGWLKNDPKPPE